MGSNAKVSCPLYISSGDFLTLIGQLHTMILFLPARLYLLYKPIFPLPILDKHISPTVPITFFISFLYPCIGQHCLSLMFLYTIPFGSRNPAFCDCQYLISRISSSSYFLALRCITMLHCYMTHITLTLYIFIFRG